MTALSEVFLGVIAFATLLSAALQAAVLIGVVLAMKRVNAVIDRVEHRIAPTISRAETLGEQLSQVTASAAAQLAKIERVIDDLARYANRATGTLRLVTRESDALAAGARAAVGRLVNDRGRARSGDTDDPSNGHALR